MLMWLDLFLMLTLQSGNYDAYWKVIATDRAAGCHVYNYFWVSCPVPPAWIPPYALVPVPTNALEILPTMAVAPRRDRRAQ